MRVLRILPAVLCTGIIAAACSSSGGTTTTGTVPRGTSTTRPNLSKVQPTTATTAPAVSGLPACTTLSATPGQSQAVAGTVFGTVELADNASTSCTVMGYPGLVRLSASGTTVPVNIINGLTIGIQGLFDRPPALVIVTPTQKADFTYQYSVVPTGTETTCTSSTELSVVLPGSPDFVTPIAIAMAPCNGSTVYVSPVYVAGSVGKPFT